jgi:hypothetical protein
MSFPTPQPSDAAVAAELAEIAARMAALASDPEPHSSVGAELEAIRSQLRRLAQDNAEVGARLAASLGLGAVFLEGEFGQSRL